MPFGGDLVLVSRLFQIYNSYVTSNQTVSTYCPHNIMADWAHELDVLCPNSPSASSNTKMASCCLASWKMESMFLVLSPTHLLSSSPQFTT